MASQLPDCLGPTMVAHSCCWLSFFEAMRDLNAAIEETRHPQYNHGLPTVIRPLSEVESVRLQNVPRSTEDASVAVLYSCLLHGTIGLHSYE